MNEYTYNTARDLDDTSTSALNLPPGTIAKVNDDIRAVHETVIIRPRVDLVMPDPIPPRRRSKRAQRRRDWSERR